MTSERMMMVRMPEKLHKAVRIRAAELGTSMSEIVRALLTAWVIGKVDLPELREPGQED